MRYRINSFTIMSNTQPQLQYSALLHATSNRASTTIIKTFTILIHFLLNTLQDITTVFAESFYLTLQI